MKKRLKKQRVPYYHYQWNHFRKVLDDFVVKKGYTTFKSTNYPGEISRLLHEERVASAVPIHSILFPGLRTI